MPTLRFENPALQRLILASSSPRRSEILRAAGFTFDVLPSAVDERQHPGEAAEDYVRRMATAKALAALVHYPTAAHPILGADTTVVAGHRTLGKPASPEDAAEMLRLLSGRDHQVLTGVCLVYRMASEGPLTSAATASIPQSVPEQPVTAHWRHWPHWKDVRIATTTVHFTEISEPDIQQYVDSGEPFDKAGAYAIQGLASKFVERIEGCYFNVVGLPVSLVYRMLKDLEAILR